MARLVKVGAILGRASRAALDAGRLWERTQAEPGAIRVGIDAVVISEVADAILQFRARYLERIYTLHEQESCDGELAVRTRGLAARFAAKEAALKVLRASDLCAPWKMIEVRSNPDGSCDLALHGEAAARARDVGVQSWSMSVTHEGGLAIAVVAASGAWH